MVITQLIYMRPTDSCAANNKNAHNPATQKIINRGARIFKFITDSNLVSSLTSLRNWNANCVEYVSLMYKKSLIICTKGNTLVGGTVSTDRRASFRELCHRNNDAMQLSSRNPV